MEAHWQCTKNNISFLEHMTTEMNYLEDNMWIIFDLFDDNYFELKLISLAISLDKIPLMVEQELETPNLDKIL